MSPWSQMAAQATQIGMPPVAAWSSDIHMVSYGSPDCGNLHNHVAWVMEIDTDPGYSRTIDPDMSLISNLGQAATMTSVATQATDISSDPSQDRPLTQTWPTSAAQVWTSSGYVGSSYPPVLHPIVSPVSPLRSEQTSWLRSLHQVLHLSYPTITHLIIRVAPTVGWRWALGCLSSSQLPFFLFLKNRIIWAAISP